MRKRTKNSYGRLLFGYKDPMRPGLRSLVEQRRDEALRERMLSGKLAEYKPDDEPLDYLAVIEEIEGDL